MAEQEKRKILSKFEWVLLIVALGILVMVILQNKGIYMIETTEEIELTEEERKGLEAKNTKPEANTLFEKKSRKERLGRLAEYFAKNRAAAKAEGKIPEFEWSSLKYNKDEIEYLKNRYEGDTLNTRSSTDWLRLLTHSHQTYKKVKSTFEELGIDVDEVVNVENASSLLSNPLISKSIFQKIEQEYGIPADQAEAWAKKHGHKIEDWAEFVEDRSKQ